MKSRKIGRVAAMAALWALQACGGGQEPALPEPSAARLAAADCSETALAAGDAQWLATECVRSSRRLGVVNTTAVLEQRAAPLTAAQLMDWAEAQYPSLFPRHDAQGGTSAPYVYRHYPSTQNYLGVSTQASDVAIYIFGPVSGGKLERVGSLRDFTCKVLPQNCLLQVSPASLSLQALSGGSQQSSLAVTLPALPGYLNAEVEASWTKPWLQVRRIEGGGVQVTATAGQLPAGQRSAVVKLTYWSHAGQDDLTVSVPVSFKILQGLVTPASQTLTVDPGSRVADVSGTANIERDDGVSATWSATSSASWLKLATASGSFPGQLAYRLDAAEVARLANLQDHVATVSLSTSDQQTRAFTVTLRKRMPQLAAAMPYGIPAGTKSRVVVGGSGFAQIQDLAQAVRLQGLVPSNLQRHSDTQFSFDWTPPAAGSYELTLSPPGSGDAFRTQVHVAAAEVFQVGAVEHSGDPYVTLQLEDPMRRAVYALSKVGNAVYKYQQLGGVWTVKTLSLPQPVSMGVAADGSHLYVVTLPFWAPPSLKRIDPDSFQVLGAIDLPSELEAGNISPLPSTPDGRLWLPGGSYRSALSYLDLNDRTVKSLPGNPQMQLRSTGSFVGSGDGSYMLISPSYCCVPRDPWHTFTQADAKLVRGPQGLEFGSDPRLSRDGSMLMVQHSGAVYNRQFELQGQLPPQQSGEFRWRFALTPDGMRIVALVRDSTSKFKRLDVFSTQQHEPGTTDFRKIGSIAITATSTDCDSAGHGCDAGGMLLASADNRTIIWAGNKRVQFFKLP